MKRHKPKKGKIALIIIALLLILSAAATAYYFLVYIGDGSYTDIPDDALYRSAAYYCRDNGMIPEYSHRKFAPDESTKAEQLLRALWVHDGRENSSEGERKTIEDEYKDSALWAAKNDIYKEDATAALDRALLSQIIYSYNLRLLGSAPRLDSASLSEYTDYDPASMADIADPVAWAVQYGVIKADGETLLPHAGVTRSELAQSLYSYFKLSLLTPGIDISSYQKGIEGEGMAALDGDFVFLRLYRQQGGPTVNGVEHTDECFEEFYSKAKAKGLRVGAYWFSYVLDVNDAIKDADECIKLLSGKEWDLPVAIDLEEASIEYMKSQGITPTKESVSAIITAFCERVSVAGYDVMIYTNPNMCYYMDGTGYISDECLEPYDTWVALWQSNENLSLSDMLKIRSGVTSAPGGTSVLYRNARFWQVGMMSGEYFGLGAGKSVDVDVELYKK